MYFQKFTDKNRKVTDENVIKHILSMGYDPDYFEFFKDYNRSGNIYKKKYRCQKRGLIIDSVSSLPRATIDGELIEVGFYKYSGKIISKKNLIHCEIKNEEVKITKGLQSVTYRPELYINDIRQKFGLATIKDDKINDHYTQNIIEWENDNCIRQIRLIEGRYRERWIFPVNCGKIEIKHNADGDLNLKLGYAANEDGFVNISVENGSEIFESDSSVKFPLVIGGDVEYTTSVDGIVSRVSAGSTFTSLVNGNGTSADDSSSSGMLIEIFGSSTTDTFGILTRGIFVHDTSGADSDILSAKLSIYGAAKGDALSITPNVGIYSSNPASNTSLVASDFQTVGSTLFSNIITYANWNTAGYNDFELNAAGISALNLSGYTKFSARNANYDVADNAPSWTSLSSSYLSCYFSEQGVSFEPKLVFTYRDKSEYIKLDTPYADVITINTPVDLESII